MAAVTWLDPSFSTAAPVLMWGFDIEEADPWIMFPYQFNAALELQVVKAFWDLDDRISDFAGWIDLNNDGVRESQIDIDQNGSPDHDITNLSTSNIILGWSLFPDGTFNHQDQEGGFSGGVPLDPHGVNIRDYDFNYDVNNQTFRAHNCIEDMDTN